MDAVVQSVKESGSEVLLPGEREHQREEEAGAPFTVRAHAGEGGASPAAQGAKQSIFQLDRTPLE